MKNAEFQIEKLALIYEDFNQFSEDEDFWIRLIESLAIQDITDFGCGTGLFTYKLLEKGYTLRGIEPARAMIEIAKNKQNSQSIEWIEGDYKSLQNFKTELLLLTSHVSQFIVDADEWKHFLENAFKVLKNGGYLLFDAKNPLIKPWKKYTRENYNRTKNTEFGEVNMQIETVENIGNIAEHAIYYTFLETDEKLISHNRLIYRTQFEIIQDLESAGFVIEKVYGGWNFESYSEESEEIIFLAKKV